MNFLPLKKQHKKKSNHLNRSSLNNRLMALTKYKFRIRMLTKKNSKKRKFKPLHNTNKYKTFSYNLRYPV